MFSFEFTKTFLLLAIEFGPAVFPLAVDERSVFTASLPTQIVPNIFDMYILSTVRWYLLIILTWITLMISADDIPTFLRRALNSAYFCNCWVWWFLKHFSRNSQGFPQRLGGLGFGFWALLIYSVSEHRDRSKP